MKIVIAGAGEVGSHLAKMLSHEGGDITVVDTSNDRLQHLTSIADVAAIQGSPTSINVLKNAGVQKADLFVAVYPGEFQEINIVSALLAKNLGARRVTARIKDDEFLTPENRLLFKEMGIELLFFPEKIAADEISETLKHSGAADSMEFGNGKLQIAVFKIDEDSPLLDMKLGEFTATYPDAAIHYRVIAIARNEKTIIPKFDTKFMYHDLVYTISKREGIPTLMKIFGKSSIEVDKVMIYGGGQIAEHLAKNLDRQISNVKIIEIDKEKCFQLSEKLGGNIQVVNGDGRNTDFLLEESIKEYDAFVALTDQDETNVLACVVAKKFGISKTVAEVENIEYIRLAEEMGVDTVINKKLLTAGKIFKFTLSGKARFVKYMSGTDAEVLEYTVPPGAAITKGSLKELGFPSNAIIGGIIRGSESMIAIGDTRIEEYDRVAVFALPESVKEVDKFFK